MTNHVAASFGCCGAEKKSACWEDVSAGVCKTASDCELILIFRIIIFFSLHSPLLFSSSSSSFFHDLADLPNHSFDYGGGGTTTCAAMVSHVGFTSTPKCTTEGVGEGDTTWKQMTNHVAATYGCCGSEKKSACWQDISAGVCKTATDCTWGNWSYFKF